MLDSVKFVVAALVIILQEAKSTSHEADNTEILGKYTPLYGLFANDVTEFGPSSRIRRDGSYTRDQYNIKKDSNNKLNLQESVNNQVYQLGEKVYEPPTEAPTEDDGHRQNIIRQRWDQKSLSRKLDVDPDTLLLQLVLLQ